MKLIGRKMYIDFGDYVVAVEKLSKEYSPSLGLSGQENPTELYDIFEAMGERIERKVQGEQIKRYGYDVNTYMSTPELWVTKEELTNLKDINSK